MSGGYFDHKQFLLTDIAGDIEFLITTNDSMEINSYGEEKGRNYSPETIAKFKATAEMLHKAGNMVQRIDWLISGDDSEESFHSRWKEEVEGKS
ncbi:MAG: hypothetical protein DRH26_02285 [Deltaproteobacteria bacterium]|nr:MAG: hypothetical protein DRH26_02285 [Deltaproteobacteria bacterium]